MRRAFVFGVANTPTRGHEIVPEPTTDTVEALEVPAPAPAANASATARRETTPAAATGHEAVGRALFISGLRVSPSGGSSNSSFE